LLCPSTDSRTSPPARYPLSLHDALPIFRTRGWDGLMRLRPEDALVLPWVEAGRPLRLFVVQGAPQIGAAQGCTAQIRAAEVDARSEEHTSELQSRGHLVCRLLLEKKKIA